MMFFTEKPGQGEFAGYRIGIQNYPFSDAKVVLFTRNPGKFRLGLYIAIIKDFDLDFARKVFPQVAQIVTTLGFMDEMTNYIVKLAAQAEIKKGHQEVATSKIQKSR